MSLAPGVLSVTVEFAKDIKNRAWIGRQDPYCIVRVGNHTFCTRTAVDGGRNPVWDETFEFNVGNENDLEIEIKDDEVGDDEPLGSASCTLTQVRLAGSDRLELPVLSPDHQQGIVGISLRWTPTGAFSNAAVYGYGEPEVLAGGGQYSRVAPSGAPPPPYYGVDSLQVEEVVMERERRGEYPHRRHHHQEQETEERW
ncbi:hypothetical protein Vafri_21698 [Volvox africanus]|uniref:C2 domain-containing protein n=1 Tax=Volvox africanus TaxID=51714 RepID=A0A8J4BTI1_9CHLO|nr:hypothetical protein Vafri_21698 [Volvox africanus]